MFILKEMCTAAPLQNVSEKEKAKVISYWRKLTTVTVHIAKVLKQHSYWTMIFINNQCEALQTASHVCLVAGSLSPSAFSSACTSAFSTAALGWLTATTAPT